MTHSETIRKLVSLPTLQAARGLIGCFLTTRIGGVETGGMIVETEAYHGKDDEASHSFGRRTPRNEVMFGKPGSCYVYFIYGMHYCVNVVTEEEGVGAAVLIRALEPLRGVDTMMKRRNVHDIHRLTSGPAMLCEALAIDRSLLGADLLSSPLISLEPGRSFNEREIGRSTRKGISRSTHLEWRFFLEGNRFVSGRGG